MVSIVKIGELAGHYVYDSEANIAVLTDDSDCAKRWSWRILYMLNDDMPGAKVYVPRSGVFDLLEIINGCTMRTHNATPPQKLTDMQCVRNG